MFDAGSPAAHAVVMHCDKDGHWLGAEKITDPGHLAELVAVRDRVDAAAVTLNEYLGEQSLTDAVGRPLRGLLDKGLGATARPGA